MVGGNVEIRCCAMILQSNASLIFILQQLKKLEMKAGITNFNHSLEFTNVFVIDDSCDCKDNLMVSGGKRERET